MLENPIDVKGLIEYQAGVVASRTVVDKKAGTVTIFSFDEGQGLSEHVAPYDALVYALDGEAQVVVSGKEHKLSAGQIIKMPAGAPHSVKALKKYKMLLIMIREK
ncbi:MAG: cupin domain-containing protein [Limisphaerales bacterium]|jgi:quercetin dioxygenase-like cupin family protein|nr:cupin domain-containing protein [Verrucomicrobiota bacterium]TAH54376.1 MAG: cupin domain-containing protein [Methanosarcina mazei]